MYFVKIVLQKSYCSALSCVGRPDLWPPSHRAADCAAAWGLPFRHKRPPCELRAEQLQRAFIKPCGDKRDTPGLRPSVTLWICTAAPSRRQSGAFAGAKEILLFERRFSPKPTFTKEKQPSFRMTVFLWWR